MNAQQEETLTVLNHLIEICREGQEGFRTAAEAIEDDTELKMLLSSFSLQRAKFAGELESLAIGMGEHDPEREAGAPSMLHRGWIHLRSLIGGKSLYAILSECERGERVAKEAYQKAMHNDLPEPVREAIINQRQEVIAAHNTIRTLRDACSPRAEHGRGRGRNGAAEVWQEMKGRRQADAGRRKERNATALVLGALATGFALGLAVYLLELRNDRVRQTRRRWLRWMENRADEGTRMLKAGRRKGREAMNEIASHLPGRQASFPDRMRGLWPW